MDQSNKQVHCSRNKQSIVTKKTHLKCPLICGGDQLSFIQLQTGILLYTGSRGLNTGQTFLQKGNVYLSWVVWPGSLVHIAAEYIDLEAQPALPSSLA
jgi:hypothetical protein